MPVFPSERWVDEYVALVNDSDECRKATSGWKRDVAYVLEAEPARGVPEDVWIHLEIRHGRCRAAGYGSSPKGGRPPRFILRAPYSLWKDVISGELDPVKAIMRGRMRFRGDLQELLCNVRGANVLVNLAESVPTRFVDEAG